MCGISGYISDINLIADNGVERTLELMKRVLDNRLFSDIVDKI